MQETKCHHIVTRCSSSQQTATVWPCHFRITILQYSYCPKEFYCCVLGAETLCKGTSSLSHLINVPIRKNWRRILHSSPNNSNLSWETSLAPYVDPPGRSKYIFHANSTPWLLSQVLVLSLGGQGECYRAPLPLIGLPSITFLINLPEFYLNYWNLIGYDTRSIFCDRQLVANSVRMLTKRNKSVSYSWCYKIYHMRGKITDCWLAEKEGIFSQSRGTFVNQEGVITWCWLSLFAVCGNDLLIAI